MNNVNETNFIKNLFIITFLFYSLTETKIIGYIIKLFLINPTKAQHPQL